MLVDNAAVGLSTGPVPNTVTQMARDAIAFIDALGLSEIDLLGYSIGRHGGPRARPSAPPARAAPDSGRDPAARADERDKPNGRQVRIAQYDAIVEWGIPEPSKLARLAGIRQPTLVANGDNDTMIPTINSHILGQHLPNVRVRIYSDAGQGFLFQWPTEFAHLVTRFLA